MHSTSDSAVARLKSLRRTTVQSYLHGSRLALVARAPNFEQDGRRLSSEVARPSPLPSPRVQEEGGGTHLIPVVAMPWMKVRCVRKNRISTGRMTSTEPAISR